MLTSTSAQSQYFTRPADEKFKTLADIRANAETDRLNCLGKDMPLSNLKVVVHGAGVALQSKTTGTLAQLTHWAGSQLARYAGAPAAYLRTLPANLAADCLNYGLDAAVKADDPKVQMYVRADRAAGTFTARAITSPEYKRLHDVAVIDQLARLHQARPTLDLPPIWEGGKGGAYRGDRDMFVIMTDGGSIVNDPTAMGGNGEMHRGIIVRNSEVGRAQLEMLTFYLRWICGNHMIGGFQMHGRTSRRHVGRIHASFADMSRDAMRFFNQSAREDEDRIVQLARIELGKDRPEVVLAGRSLGLTAEQAESSYAAAEMHEQNPRSIWGYANGITRISQQETYQDDRFQLDMLAAKLLRRKVAA